ncbi:hypothetical protein CC241_07890, partial [Listeria monocytogenes]|nr:hypothetical protein [Listeria monocytogenes]
VVQTIANEYKEYITEKIRLSDNGIELIDSVKKICDESNLNYIKLNKALYLADKELYLKRLYS